MEEENNIQKLDEKKENQKSETENQSEVTKLLEESHRILEGEICVLLTGSSNPSSDCLDRLLEVESMLESAINLLKNES